MTIINATPHTITILSPEDGSVAAEFPASGTVARVAEKATNAGNITGVPLFAVSYGEVQGIPPESEGVLYIVSAMVLAAAPNRGDLVAPYGFMRNDQGAIIGARGFRR